MKNKNIYGKMVDVSDKQSAAGLTAANQRVWPTAVTLTHPSVRPEVESCLFCTGYFDYC
jgi:hypothetical protein